MIELLFVALALVGGTAVVGAGAYGLRKRMPRGDLAKELGPAYFVKEASMGRIVLRVQRDKRVFEAKISLGTGSDRWWVTSARPPGTTPWEARPAVDGLRDELERIMVRGRAERLSMVGGEITIEICRGTSPVDIEEMVDVAAALAAVIDRELPSAVSIDVDPALFANELRDAVGGASGIPFGVSTSDRK